MGFLEWFRNAIGRKSARASCECIKTHTWNCQDVHGRPGKQYVYVATACPKCNICYGSLMDRSMAFNADNLVLGTRVFDHTNIDSVVAEMCAIGARSNADIEPLTFRL